jgi:hypothetical protein
MRYALCPWPRNPISAHQVFSIRNPHSQIPNRKTRNPQRLHLFQIFSNDTADLISVSGQNIVDDFFGGAF